jgi:NTE family protein
MMTGRSRLAWLGAVLLLLAATAMADEAAADRPLRIGLALGGGGARGAAHVGVLRVLEEQNITVDYVAGTSMGSIVGSLYALGLSADEIERALLAVDWGELFVDRPSRRTRSMRRKEDDTATFFPIEFGLRHGRLVTPRGLIAGQKFAFAFPHTGMIDATRESFDELPIPYRAVATDLETGDKVVLDRGNLLRAVRASMSIPGVFPPVEIDGRLLVDGYLTSNVPVDVVRAMGADLVIAVEVGRRMEDTTRDELETIGGIQEQAARIRSQLALQDELGRADIVIRPDLEQWSGQEYDRLAEIMPPGETAARRHLAELAPLGVPDPVFAAWRQHVESRPVDVPPVDRVALVNETRIADDVIFARIDVDPGERLDADRLLRSFEEIYELGLVERSDFELTREDGQNVLRVFVHEKPYAPYLVYLGGSYRLSYSGFSPLNLHLRVNKLEVNRRGAEWRTDLSVGSVFGIRSEFYQPIDVERRWFVAPQGQATYQEDAFFVDQRYAGSYRVRRLLAGLDLGRSLGRTAEIRAGAFAGNMATDWASGIFPVPERNDGVAGLRAALTIDTLDDHRVPQRGMLLTANLITPQRWLGNEVAYDRLWGQLFVAAGSRDDRVLIDLQGGTSFGSDMPYYQDFYLGGLRALSGYHLQRLRGQAYGLASVGWLHRLGGGNLPFSSKTYLGLWADAGNAWFDSRDASLGDLIYNAAISLLFETPLGPLHLGYGHADDGRDAFHLDFGIHLASPANAVP